MVIHLHLKTSHFVTPFAILRFPACLRTSGNTGSCDCHLRIDVGRNSWDHHFCNQWPLHKILKNIFFFLLSLLSAAEQAVWKVARVRSKNLASLDFFRQLLIYCSKSTLCLLYLLFSPSSYSHGKRKISKHVDNNNPLSVFWSHHFFVLNSTVHAFACEYHICSRWRSVS